MTTNVNPPGSVNLLIAIFALVGATLSIVGFIAHYLPRQQYADFCDILHHIHSIYAVDDWQWSSDQRSKLLQHYRSVSTQVEQFHYLVATPWYRSAFHLPTAWRLKTLRERASILKIELIALSQIQKSKDLQNMDMSLSPISTTSTLRSSDASADNAAPRTQVEVPPPHVPSSRLWWRWTKTPQATTLKVSDDCDCSPV